MSPEMRPVRALTIYLAVVFIGAAAIAPWLYFAVQKLSVDFPAFEKLARNPFHRYVNRSLLILAVSGLWPLLRALGITSWDALGLQPTKRGSKNFGIGFAIGFASLAVLASGAFVSGAVVGNTQLSQGKILQHLLNASLAALAVGTLEEILFRGGVYGGIRKVHSARSAVVVSSAIYAIVHFFSKPSPPETVNWATGFFVLGQMLRGFAEFQVLVPAFFNLTIVGIILAMAFQWSGTLFFSIGLHAGWIFWLKSWALVTVQQETNSFWGTNKLIDGWAATLVLLGVLALLKTRWRKNYDA